MTLRGTQPMRARPRLFHFPTILSWASNLNPGCYKNICFDCQEDEIGGLSNGIDSIKTLAKSVANNSVIINTQVEPWVATAPLAVAELQVPIYWMQEQFEDQQILWKQNPQRPGYQR